MGLLMICSADDGYGEPDTQTLELDLIGSSQIEEESRVGLGKRRFIALIATTIQWWLFPFACLVLHAVVSRIILESCNVLRARDAVNVLLGCSK